MRTSTRYKVSPTGTVRPTIFWQENRWSRRQTSKLIDEWQSLEAACQLVASEAITIQHKKSATRQEMSFKCSYLSESKVVMGNKICYVWEICYVWRFVQCILSTNELNASNAEDSLIFVMAIFHTRLLMRPFGDNCCQNKSHFWHWNYVSVTFSSVTPVFSDCSYSGDKRTDIFYKYLKSLCKNLISKTETWLSQWRIPLKLSVDCVFHIIYSV